MTIVERILELCEQKNITANKLALECKINSPTITQWKKGAQNPSLDALIKIADFFDVSLDYLTGRVPASVPTKFAKEFCSAPKLAQDMTWKYLCDFKKAMAQDEKKQKEVQ